jgi:hypothetical protein
LAASFTSDALMIRQPRDRFGNLLASISADNVGQCQQLADAVEKVENRTTPKISQMVIFELPRRCDALQCRYEGPWSFL